MWVSCLYFDILGEKIKKKYNRLVVLCDPGEARTLDPMIKSHLLYQLSYGVNNLISLSETFFAFAMQRYGFF